MRKAGAERGMVLEVEGREGGRKGKGMREEKGMAWCCR